MKMKRRIFIFAVLLSGIAIVITSVLVALAAYDDFFSAIKGEVVSEASYINRGYELAGEAYLESLAHEGGRRATLIASDGAVIFDSRSAAENMDNHLDRPEVRDAVALGAGESTRYSDTIREQTYYYAVLQSDGTVLRVSNTTASVFASFDRLLWIVPLIVLGILIVSVFVVSFVTRRIVRPINNIDLEHPENNVVYEEIIPLLKRVREQRLRIDEQIQEIDRGRHEFTAITENMSEGFLVLDCGGKVLSHNKSAARMLTEMPEVIGGGSVSIAMAVPKKATKKTAADGIASGNLSGVNILALNREENFRKTVRLALEGTAREKVVELHGRQCQLFANPVMEGGAVQGVILLLMDVTEKQERESLRHEFTTNVSHELKTPLTVISGCAEIMANGIAKEKDIPEFAGSIYREAQRMIVLVNDLMFLSGLEENTQLEKGTVDLLALSEEVARRLTYKAGAQGIELTVTGEPVKIDGFPTVLDEMVHNLIENAIKYNRAGGSVTVEVNKNGDAAELTVSDTGIGIPVTERERIFERFYRVDKSRNNIIPGTGLGLSIVKHGAILHEAKIELESGEKGSRFILSFQK